MADKKISALIELAEAPAVDDELAIVDTSATETKKITTANLMASKVTGPASAVDNRVAVFDQTTGKIIKDGGKNISDVVEGDGTVNPTNIINNGDFSLWPDGTSSVPGGWTAGGVGYAVAQESTIKKLGLYSAKFTNSASALSYLTQSVHLDRGINYWKGRKITLGCWVYSANANKARIRFVGATDNPYSSFHTGDSTWQWLYVTGDVPSSATAIEVRFYSTDTANETLIAYFDGAMCVDGEHSFAFSDKPLPRGGTIVAETDETKFSHKIPVVIGGTTYYIMLTAT